MYKHLADICGYELPTNMQNFTQQEINRSENIPKRFRGLLFSKHPVNVFMYNV